MRFGRRKEGHAGMMWCRERVHGAEQRTRLFGCRAAFPPRSHRQTADGTAASLVGQNAEQKRGRQTATKHPYIDSFPLLLLFSSPLHRHPLKPPPHPRSHTPERELPEICLHILLLSASPLSPALRWIHHQVS